VEEPVTYTVSAHAAVRPTWACGACGQPWPCPTSREELIAEFDGNVPAMSVYMAGKFLAALDDVPRVACDGLHLRFLGWIRQTR
jgi:hypothetical protein